MRILFLDDDKNRHDYFMRWFTASRGNPADVTIVEDAPQAIDALKNQDRFDIVFLDHDLGGKIYVQEVEGTGLQVTYEIEKLTENKIPKQIIVHTHNTYKGYIMLDVLKKLTPTQYIPFSNLLSATMKW